ncbi:carbonic anhydrase family protein [Tahibacter caeni]|uniref:carbonic anhydrase family protein n=1 Tax=Tahibacter caeni TaxID=1453545 RepID=UPI0021479DAB|nr:carbonic anhydrase family protein [Tahibacter caeni]
MHGTHRVATPSDRARIQRHRRNPVVSPATAAAGFRTLAVLLFLFAASGCARAPARDAGHSSAAYEAAAAAQWTYPEGPSWGESCAKLPPPQQSPIDLTKVTTTAWNASTVITQATFDSHDQNVVFQAALGPSVAMTPGVDDATRPYVYTVAGFHFHYRNEHVVAGNPAYELHIKTTDAYGGTAVFAVLWTADDTAGDDPTLTAAYQALSAPPNSIAALDLGRVLWRFGQQPFYSYVGSLTTPPCTTGIRWFVLQTPVRTSSAIIGRLNAALIANGMPRNNVRTVRSVAQPQPVVYLVTPK